LDRREEAERIIDLSNNAEAVQLGAKKDRRRYSTRVRPNLSKQDRLRKVEPKKHQPDYNWKKVESQRCSIGVSRKSTRSKRTR
jgi:hypothetical protein